MIFEEFIKILIDPCMHSLNSAYALAILLHEYEFDEECALEFQEGEPLLIEFTLMTVLEVDIAFPTQDLVDHVLLRVSLCQLLKLLLNLLIVVLYDKVVAHLNAHAVSGSDGID